MNLRLHLLSALVLLVMVALALGSSDSDEDSGGSASSEPDKVSAWIMAQSFVKDRLKAPGTASFGSVFGDYQSPDDCVVELGDGRFRCTGWVDSENSFGAKIRTRFSCIVKYVGNDKWQLEHINFEE